MKNKILSLILLLTPIASQAADPFNSIFEGDYDVELLYKVSEKKIESEIKNNRPSDKKVGKTTAKEYIATCGEQLGAYAGDKDAAAVKKLSDFIDNESANKDETLKTLINKCALEKGIIQRVEFIEADEKIGGLSVYGLNDTQKIKFNALNYRLWFGGDHYLPFQLLLSHAASDEPTEDKEAEALNADALLDPESGIAISVPFLWRYKGSGSDFCHFIKNDSELGFCTFGGRVVSNFKNLETLDGKSEVAFGVTAEVGASALFPIFEAKDDQKAGYLALGYKLFYSHSDFDDASKLFNPLSNAKGEIIDFEKSMAAQQFGIKLALDQKVALGATWTKALDNQEYIGESISISLESQF